jgi:hypothetical protein
MPLTRITHENISNNTIEIHDLSASAVDALLYTANSALIQANSAFNAANNASDPWVRGQANAAFIQANAAFSAANNAGGADQFARNTANAAFVQANTAIEISTLAGANNFVKYNFPLIDHGFVGPPVGLGDEETFTIWDNKLSAQPQTWGFIMGNTSLPLVNNTITLDAGYLS